MSAATCTTAARSRPALGDMGYVLLKLAGCGRDRLVHSWQRVDQHRAVADRQARGVEPAQHASACQRGWRVPGAQGWERKQRPHDTRNSYAATRLKGVASDQRLVAQVEERDMAWCVARCA